MYLSNFIEIMNIEESWDEIIDWLGVEKLIELPKGSEFRTAYIEDPESIEIVPLRTGIPRRITENQWDDFCNKFKEVKRNGYDPYRPGHYAQISHNASYLVAILREFEESG